MHDPYSKGSYYSNINNTMSPFLRIAKLRQMAIWDLTSFIFAQDNPANVTEDDKTAFTEYRNRWKTHIEWIKDGSFKTDKDKMNELTWGPALPDGWMWMTRSSIDLPYVLIKSSECNMFDKHYGHVEDGIGGMNIELPTHWMQKEWQMHRENAIWWKKENPS